MPSRAKPLAFLTAALLAMPMGIATAQEPEPIAPEGAACGGIAGVTCPEGYSCVDNPQDDCDPNAGGADCAGICSIAAEQDETQRGDGTGQDKKGCDYNNPDQQYVSKDPDQCAAIRFFCEAGQQPFFNDCGCGCQPVEP
ncbi:hypothetical protein HPC49_30470 [Pyxidicoccus fallax]|uniref:Lipoprotein n=1 Tax=Pyxidicoccus fallax TaxID=394095 RepID=A0A848LSF7_9BACT|nr:hypothetical protein [Pyxidicoccus fallax]NMO20696.1 hypothetical protein [Pyxidicoccus fallax]NPC82534.1 hypothetical protein [Pyxidicoccus fallax]